MLTQIGTSILPDMKTPKSPRRFAARLFGLHDSPSDPTPPVPSVPSMYGSTSSDESTHPASSYGSIYRKGHTPSSSQSSAASSGLGYGAQVVKTPLEAMQSYRLPKSPDSMTYSQPQLKAKASTKSLKSVHQHTRSEDAGRPPRPPRPEIDTSIRPDEVKLSPPPPPKDRRHTLKARASLYSVSPRDSSPVLPQLKHLRSQPSLGGWWTPEFPLSIDTSDQVIKPPSAPAPPSARQGTLVPKSSMSRRSTVRPSPRPPSIPFEATLLGKAVKPSPTSRSVTLVTLRFGYNIADPSKNTQVTIPWPILNDAGGHLADFLREYVADTATSDHRRPRQMTKNVRKSIKSPVSPRHCGSGGSDEEDSEEEFDLNALLREEYMKSIYIPATASTPNFSDFPLPPTLPPGMSMVQSGPPPTFPPLPPLPIAGVASKMASLPAERRRAVKNQYTQKEQYPSPTSTLLPSMTPLGVRRNRPDLQVDAKLLEGGGSITELTVLLLRDASLYHLLTARLITGVWPPDCAEQRRGEMQVECAWLGVPELGSELKAEAKTNDSGSSGKSVRSFVMNGGDGYI